MRTAHKTLKTFILKQSYGTFFKVKCSKGVHIWSQHCLCSSDLIWYFMICIQDKGVRMEMKLKLNVTHWCMPKFKSDFIGHIGYKHVVLQKCWWEKCSIVLFFSLQRNSVWTIFFIMKSWFYHFNSTGDAVVTREILKGTNTSSLKADVRVPHHKESIDPLISVHIVLFIYAFLDCFSHPDSCIADIRNISTSSGDPRPLVVAKRMI